MTHTCAILSSTFSLARVLRFCLVNAEAKAEAVKQKIRKQVKNNKIRRYDYVTSNV